MKALAILAAAALAGASPATPQAPRPFVESIYAQYRHADYDPMSHGARIFAPRLLAAIREDERLAHGEVGFLDGDPLCDCQDTGGLKTEVREVRQQAPSAATARVMLHFPGPENRLVRLSLLRTAAGWRVADVSSADDPSLLRSLETSNRKARGRRH